MHQPVADLKMHLLGVFRVVDKSCNEIQPRGKKACAILALLAVAPEFSRSRKWLADKLWSDRGSEQAAGSFRQALSEIRKSFGANSKFVLSQGNTIQIVVEQMWVDIEQPDYLVELERKSGELPEFLENLDIIDLEFENWRRNQQSRFENIYNELRGSASIDNRTNVERNYDVVETPMILRTNGSGSSKQHQLFSEIMTDIVCSSLSNAASIDIVYDLQNLQEDMNFPPNSLTLQAKAFEFASEGGVGINLTRRDDRRVLLSSVRKLDCGDQMSLESTEILQLINEAVDTAIFEFANTGQYKKDAQSSAALCFNAVQNMFSLEPGKLEEADTMLQNAYDINQKGIYLAWRAYLRTIWLGESPNICRETIIEEMRDLMLRAVECDPNNSLVMALSAYMYTTWLKDHQTAFELASKSVAINPANAIGMSYLGIINTHMGNFSEGMRLTTTAAKIAGPGPYRYQLQQMAFNSTAFAGNYLDAARIGESIRKENPQYLAALRMLVLIYANLNDEEKLSKSISELGRYDNEVSVELLRDRYTKSDDIRNSPLLRELVFV